MPGPRITNEFSWIIILSLLIVLPYLSLIGFENEVILGSPKGDIVDFFVPIRSLGFGLLSKGVLPLWNSYIFCGAPLLAESQLAIFYPLNLIHQFLPITSAINLLIILHQVMAGIFMYIYLKRITLDTFASLIGATVFALSSLFITRIFAGHLTILCATAWLPLLFFLIDKSISKEGNIFNILMGLVLTLQILSGHLQFVFISLIALFLYAASMSLKCYKNNYSLKETLYPFYCFFGSLMLAVGLSAIQLVPLGEFVQESMRLNNPVWNYNFSMPPENLITILSPGFLGYIRNYLYWGKWFPWEVSLYVGILPLLLSFLAILKSNRYSKFFTLLFLLSLILSLGVYLPFYRHIFKYMVGFNMFRANGRFLTLAIFALSVLTALGCKDLKSYYSSNQTDRKLIFIIIFGLVLILVLLSFKFIISYFPSIWKEIHSFIISYDKFSTQRGYNFGYQSNSMFVKKIIILDLNKSILFTSIGTFLFIFYIKRLIKLNMMKFLIASIIVCDLWSFGSNYFSFSYLKDYYLNKKLVSFLKSNIGQNRFLLLNTFNINTGIMHKIPSIDGYAGVMPKRSNEFINFTQDLPLDGTIINPGIKKLSRLFELLNLKFVLVKKKYIASDFSHLKRVFSNGDVDVYQTSTFLPKAFIVHKAKIIPDRDNILKTLSDDSFNFRETVILEEPVGLKGINNSSSILEPEPVIATYSPNRVVVNADTKADGYLILCDNYYPGWRAYVDAKRTPILRANYILRAVPLSPGNHTVEFIYSPASLKIGVFITLSFLALSIIMLVILWYRKI